MNRRRKKLLVLLPLLFIGLGALVIWDFYDRGLLDSSENYPEEKALFHQDKTIEGTDTKPQDCPIQPNTASQYYDSGQLKSIGPVAEEHREFSEYRIGYWHEFYENGQLKSSGNYKLDTFIQCCYDGPCDWYYSYKYGEWKYYYDNGKLKAKGTYQIIKKQEDTSCQGGDQINFGTVTDSWQFYDREGKQITPNKNDIAEIEITGIIYGWEMEIQ